MQADLALASQRPAWVVGVGIENALGSGAFRGTDALELTVGLSLMALVVAVGAIVKGLHAR